MKRSNLIGVAFVLLAAGSADAFGAVKAGVAEDQAGKIDELVRLYEAKEQFSGVVLVADHGRILFEKAYGLVNREWNVPNTTDTRFRIGSVTKPFTAATRRRLPALR